jgi:UDP-GlcNAc:undecaprenyl-phosphate GlcNAc-1-phosphate transferase
MFLGFVLATLAITVQGQGGPFAATLVPIVVLAVPIFDTTFVTVTRILNGVPVTQGGTDHTMHRLVILGLSERRTVVVFYAVSAIFGLSTLAVYQATTPLFYALLLLVLVVLAGFGLYLASTQAEARQRPKRVFSQKFGAVMRALFGGFTWKSFLGIVADLLLVAATFIAAHHLRFGATPPGDVYDVMLSALPAVIGLKIAIFYASDLYQGIWRHAGTPELVRLVGASTIASGLTYVGLIAAFGLDRIAPAVVVLDWMLATGAIAMLRFGFRGLRQYFAAQRESGPRVLIYGSGPNALLALRYFRQDGTGPDRTVVGFLTDDMTRIGSHAQGLSVVGSLDDLADQCKVHDAEEIIIASEDLSEARTQAVERRCLAHGIPCRHFSLSLRPPASPENRSVIPSSGDGSSKRDAPTL